MLVFPAALPTMISLAPCRRADPRDRAKPTESAGIDFSWSDRAAHNEIGNLVRADRGRFHGRENRIRAVREKPRKLAYWGDRARPDDRRAQSARFQLRRSLRGLGERELSGASRAVNTRAAENTPETATAEGHGQKKLRQYRYAVPAIAYIDRFGWETGSRSDRHPPRPASSEATRLAGRHDERSRRWRLRTDRFALWRSAAAATPLGWPRRRWKDARLGRDAPFAPMLADER